jgi:methionyl aminopeptidase
MNKPTLKNNVELKKMRAAGRLAAETLDFITPHVQPGTDTLTLNTLCHNYILEHGATPAPLGYRGYTKSICTSLNDVVCHGIPSQSDVLKDGDILNIDVTVILDGWHGDTSRMFLVGDVAPEARALIDTTYEAMMAGIHALGSGVYVSEAGRAIQTLADAKGYGVVKDYCGHGLGRLFHEPPMVVHYFPQPNVPDLRLRKGMTFTVEPMINTGSWECVALDDGWTVKTRDGGLSAQFEHTLAITDGGVEILTESPKGWHKPPYL